MDSDSGANKNRLQQLIDENRRLVQRCLELEAASRHQVEKLRAANAVLTKGDVDMQSLLENAAVAFALTDQNLRIAVANRTMASFLGYATAELPGLNFASFVYVGKIPAFNRLIGGSGTARAEELIELVARDGSLVPCRIVHTLWQDEHGSARGHVILAFDAAEEIASARRLREMEAAMAEMEKSRVMFVDVVARELRAPARGVVGMSRMLLDAGLTPRQAELAGVIHSSAGSLVRLVDDLVDIAGAAPGVTPVRPEPVSASDLAVGVANLFRIRAEEKGLKLLVHTASSVPGRILADPHILRRVLTHLLDNAVRFTDSGKVTLSVDPVGSRIRFMVSDTGPGVDPDVARNLFQDEVVPRGPQALRHGGIGAGLAVCKRLVAAMGGGMGYDSRPGHGSEFHFSLPLAAADADSGGLRLETPAEAVHLPPLSILVADANPVSSRFAQACLRFDGHAATMTPSGLDAAEKCRETRYDLVILDSLLPQLNGLETLRLIRENEAARSGRRTPVLVMTSSGAAGREEEFLRAGADAVVAKPLDTVTFMAALGRASGVKPLAVSREAAPGQYSARAGGGVLRRLDAAQLSYLGQSMPKSQFAGILRHFMEDAAPDLLKLAEWTDRQTPDSERIAFAAAKGRGLAGHLGFAALADILRRLERAARACLPAEDLRRIAQEIAPAMDDSLEEMQRILPETFALISDMRGPVEE